MRRGAGLVGLVALGLLAGCGGGKGTLSGKVAVKGKPLAAGTVMVQCASGEVLLGNIADGAYQVEDVSLGVLKVAVIPGAAAPPQAFDPKRMREAGALGRERAEREAADAARATAKSGTVVPPEYQKPESTPLTWDTAKGLTFDIAIP